jgi:hypothetical protein
MREGHTTRGLHTHTEKTECERTMTIIGEEEQEKIDRDGDIDNDGGNTG